MNISRTYLVTVFCAIAAISYCKTGEISVKHDAFKGVNTLSMDIKADAEEDVWTLRKYEIKMNFFREVNGNNRGPVYVNLRVEITRETDDNFAKQAFLQIDNAKYDLKIDNIEKEIQMEATAKADRSESSAEIQSQKILKGRLELPAALETAILAGSSLVFRVYLGNKPLTLVLNADNANQGHIKRFFAHSQEFLSIKLSTFKQSHSSRRMLKLSTASPWRATGHSAAIISDNAEFT